MPAIPVIRQQTVASMAGLGPGPTDSGRGLAALGEAFSDIGRVNTQIKLREIERQKKNDALDAKTVISDFRMRATKRFLEMQGQAAPGAAGFTPSFINDLDGLLRDSMESLSSPIRNLVKQEAEGVRESLYVSALKFEAAQGMAHRSSQFDADTDAQSVAVGIDPDQYESALSSRLEALALLDMTPELRAARVDRLTAQLSESAAQALAKQDPEGTLAQLQAGDKADPRIAALSTESRARVQRMATASLIQQNVDAVVDVYAKDGPSAGAALLSAMDQSGIPKELQSEIRSRALAQVSAMRTERRQERAGDLVNVERAIGARTAGHGTRLLVDDLYKAGALTEGELANYHGQIDAAGRERAKDVEAQTQMAALLSSGLPLDPMDAKHKEALGRAFAMDTTAMPIGSDDWQSVALGWASRARILPPQAIEWTRQAIRSPDPKLQASAAMFYADAEITAPQSMIGFDTQTKAYAGLVSSMVSAGAEPVAAAKAANDMTYNVTAQVKDLRRDQYKEHAKNTGSRINVLLDRDFDPGLFSSPPAATQALAADFGMQEARYYEITGDIARAQEMAWSDVKRVYGPSRVNGELQMMMMPPERFGVSPETVRAEIGDWLKANPQADGTTAADVLLVPDASTQRNVFSLYDGQAIRPSYKAIGKSGDILIGADELPMQYTLPTEDEVRQKLQSDSDAAKADAIRKAKEQREMERFQELNAGLGML